MQNQPDNVSDLSRSQVSARYHLAFRKCLRLFNGKLCVFKHRLDLKGYATQMPGTATFWKRCGEATAEDG
jgi:hypothetical protein